MSEDVIDARLRPPFLHSFFGANPRSSHADVVRWLNRRLGAADPEHFARITSVPDLLAEMDAAGIARGVVVGRSTPTVHIPNEDVAGLVTSAAGRLIGVASVDPVRLGSPTAAEEAVRAIRELGLAGLNLDAGFYATPLCADDERLMLLYEACVSLDVPAFIMSGPTTPDLEFNDPFAVDRVARTFPKLRIICCHGFYPRIDDIIAVAFRNENVFVSPDMYVFAPGGHRYVEAARGFLREQLLFGTSFPFRPMRQTVEEFRALVTDAATRALVMGGNARRVLNLQPAAATATPPLAP